jgi:hypothetical protein
MQSLVDHRAIILMHMELILELLIEILPLLESESNFHWECLIMCHIQELGATSQHTISSYQVLYELLLFSNGNVIL